MIALNQIKEAIVSQLHKRGFRVYDENITKTMLDKGPLVQVMLEPMSVEPACGGLYRTRTLLIDCAYLECDKPSRAGIYDALERMEQAIGDSISLTEMKISVLNRRYNITDEIAHYLFDMNFMDPIEMEPADLMETLKLEEKIDGNA